LLVDLGKRPSMLLGGALMLALLLPLLDLTACAAGEEGRSSDEEGGDAVHAAAGGDAGARTVVVISESTNITLALGNLEGQLEAFPDVETGLASLRVDMPLNITGQLVDGTYTLLSYGGGRDAARRNNGVAGHGEQIRWWFAGQEQAPIPVAWRSPDDSSSAAINGTFSIRNWLPEPGLAPNAGVYEMRFNFSGTRVHYPGWGEFQIYPPTELRLDATVVFPTAMSILGDPGQAEAGSNLSIRGEVRGSDGLGPGGGIVAYLDGHTIGPSLPDGLCIDDVAVSVPGIPTTVFRDGFESAETGWSSGGEPDDWEIGTPARGAAYSGARCLATDLDGSYSHMADEWVQTPRIDLSGYQTDARVSFAARSELAWADRAELRVWNGSDWSDPVRIEGTAGAWQSRAVDLGTLTCRGHPFPVAGTNDMRVRFQLKSLTPSANVAGGSFGLDWAVGAAIAPGPQFLSFKFFPDGPYAPSYAYLKVDVASAVRFVLAEGCPRLGADGWAELDARIVDGRGMPLRIPIGRDAGSPLKIFWDGGDGSLSEVESATAPNLTGHFAAAHRVSAPEGLGTAAFVLRFEGTRMYRPAEMRVNCTFPDGPGIALDSAAPATRGERARIGGTLLLGGRPAASCQLSVSLPFEPFHIPLVSDSSGRFSAGILVPGDWPNGSFTAVVSASGAGSAAPVNASIDIRLIDELDVQFKGQRLEKGIEVQTVIGDMRFNGLAGRVVDGFGRPAPGVEVVLEAMPAGGVQPLGRAFTGPTGYFSLPYLVGWSERTGGLVIRATAVSPPSPAASAEADFTVSAGTILQLDAMPVLRPGGFVNVSGTLYEDMGGSPGGTVRGARIAIDFGGREYDALTDIGGRFTARCAVAQSDGNVSIGASFAGDNAIGPSSMSASASVAGTAPVASATLSTERRPAPAGTAVAASSAILAALGAGLIAGTEAGRVKLLVALAPLYSKIRKEEVLDQFIRGQVFGYVQANPGDHYSSIRETLHLKNGTLAYHLRTLEREDFIFSRMDGIYRRFYPSGADPARAGRKSTLKETHSRMLELIEAGPGITPKELAVKLGTSHQVASYHIRLLARRGRIRLETKGRNTLCYPASAPPAGRGV